MEDEERIARIAGALLDFVSANLATVDDAARDTMFEAITGRLHELGAFEVEVEEGDEEDEVEVTLDTGPFTSTAMALISDLIDRVSVATGQPRETVIYEQRERMGALQQRPD